jgi:peroxiredoxin Q/BCP
LRKEYETFRELNAELFPILVDDKDNAIKMENKYARKYPIYYDEEKTVANMLNQEVKLLKLGRLPALLILDPENVIRYAYYGDSMSDIPENEQLFEILRKINKNPKN